MDEATIHEIQQWLIKAEHDLHSAKRLSTGDRPLLDTAVYHCHQTAEKALKAYLTSRDVPFVKVHDLSLLVQQCVELDETFNQLRDAAEVLTPYATAFRYPGDVLEPDPSDVEEAMRLAEFAMSFVLEKIPNEAKRDRV